MALVNHPKVAPYSIPSRQQETLFDYFHNKELDMKEKDAQDEVHWLRYQCLAGMKASVDRVNSILSSYGRYRV